MADVAHQAADQVEVGWQFAVFDFATEAVTEDTAEVFVAWVGEEAAGVGEHAHKAREQAEV